MSDEKKFELNVVHSSCKSCVFADYDGKTQTGCALGRLDKYREQGTPVVEAYDHDAEFYVLNGRACPAKRSKEWADKLAGAPANEAVRVELTVRTDVVVPLESGPDVDGLEFTIESLKRLELPPLSVCVINNQSDVKVGNVVARLNMAADGLTWNFVDIVERDAEGERPTRARCIDIVVRALKGHFYTVLEAGERLPPEFTDDLDCAVVDDMARFVLLTPNDRGVGLTVSRAFHIAPMVDGNRPVTAEALTNEGEQSADSVLLKTVVDKAIYVAHTRNAPHLIERAEVVCPSLA